MKDIITDSSQEEINQTLRILHTWPLRREGAAGRVFFFFLPVDDILFQTFLHSIMNKDTSFKMKPASAGMYKILVGP